MKQILKTDILLLFIVIVLAFITWNHIPSVYIQGEGFFYFDEETYGVDPKIIFQPDQYKNYRYEDLLARATNHVLSRQFKDNMSGYLWFAFIVMLLTDIALYILVRILTSIKLIAFLATLVFSLNYIANTNMYASGGYQYFLQRGILLLPMLVAFIFLLLSLKNNALRSFIYFLLSISLYLWTTIMGYYATNFLPAFVFYPIVFFMAQVRKGLNFAIKAILIPTPFIIGTYLIVKDAGTLQSTPESGPFLLAFLNLFVDFPHNIQNILLQLSVITVPFFWVGPNILSTPPPVGVQRELYLWFRGLTEMSSSTRLLVAETLTAILYLAAFMLIWRLKPKWIKPAIFSILCFISMMFLNFFLNRIEVERTIDALRYYYYSSTMVAVFWGIFLSVIFLQKKWLISVITAIFLLWYISYNYLTVKSVYLEEYRFSANRDILEAVKQRSSIFKSKPVYVYLPGTLGGYGARFAKIFYAHPDSRFDFESPETSSWNPAKLIKEGIDPKDVFVLRFDYQTRKVVDETEKWRSLLEELKNK